LRAQDDRAFVLCDLDLGSGLVDTREFAPPDAEQADRICLFPPLGMTIRLAGREHPVRSVERVFIVLGMRGGLVNR